jgi:hypothetical protein
MAALTHPISVIPHRQLRVVAPIDHGRREFRELPWSFQEPTTPAPRIASISERRHRREVLLRRRRFVALAMCAAVLAATWGIGGLLAGLKTTHLETIPGSQRTANGYVYTVQPGDSVWSIATELDPSGDPRPVVAKIDAELGGTSIVPGEHIVLP